MKLNFNCLEKEEFAEILQCLDFVAGPPATKKSYPKKTVGRKVGSRKLVEQIYSDRITFDNKKLNEEFGEKVMNLFDEDTLASFDNDNFDEANSIFNYANKYAFNKIPVSLTIVNKLFNLKIKEEQIELYKGTVESLKHNMDEYEEQLEDKHSKCIEKAVSAKEKIITTKVADLAKLRERHEETEREYRELKKESEKKEKQIGKLESIIEEVNAVTENLSAEIDKTKGELSLKTSENSVLTDKLQSLQQKLDYAKENSYIPDKSVDLLGKILAQLSRQGKSKAAVLEIFNDEFDEDASLIEVWEELDEGKFAMVEEVYDRMNEQEIEHADLDSLTDAENRICMQYILVNNLRMILYGYLSKKSANETLQEKFDTM